MPQTTANRPKPEAMVVPDPPARLSDAAPTVFDRPMRRLSILFNVVRVSAPRGTFTADDGVWRFAATPLADEAATLRLRDNGIRAAVGRASDAAALEQWLDGIADRRTATDQLRPNASRLVDLELGPCDPQQTVWHVQQTGRLKGRLFVDAQARFKMAYELRSPSLDDVWVRIMPELEEPPGPPTWKITPEGARQVRERRRHPFRDLIFEAMIPKGGFLLLGPTADVYDLPLAGRPFFIRRAAGPQGAAPQMRESIYVIRPMVAGGGDPLTGQAPQR